MSKPLSLMRYPGGKAKIYNFVKEIIDNYGLHNKTYVEPFSGGFGLGLKLLENNQVKRVIINDYDKHIYYLWKCVFFHTKKLIEKIENTPINVEEWQKQKEIYINFSQYSILDIGFSTLFLNRCNYSGILNGGPIGGFEQRGKYKIDCRFNKQHIIACLEEISKYKKQVEVYNFDAITLIDHLRNRESDLFYYFDPPYVKKGKVLYFNAYGKEDHIALRNMIINIKTNWIMTYDEEKFIEDLYKEYFVSAQILNYSVNTKRKAKELFISNFYTEEG